jgi:two-component system, OmpR family, sensor kinase
MRASTIRARLLASFLVIAVLSAAGLSFYFLTELEDFALRKLEERLDTQARMLVATRVATYQDKAITPVQARSLMSTTLLTVGDQTPSRMRMLTATGTVVADNEPSGATSNMAKRAEVLRALHGEYATATRIDEGGRVALYVAVPVLVRAPDAASPKPIVIGVAYVSASTFSIRTLLRDYRLRLAWVLGLFALVVLVTTELFARGLSRPLSDLAAGVARFGGGEHGVRVLPAGSRETREVALSFNTLADKVERAMTELRAEERRKSRFVSDVSHELRTPLTAIRGAAETLLEGDVESDDAKRFLATIVGESDRLARLANDLIILQRIEGATGELPLRRIELGTVVRRAVEALEPLMEERGVRVTVDGEAPDVLGDIDRIQQVVGNLVDNASRVSPEGGTITVTLAHEDRWASVAVADCGPGIADEDLEHVFERFYRSQPSRDRSSGGVGLGLSIVKAIVVAHAGEILATNGPDGGAVFTVRFPALDPLPMADEAAS